MRRIFYDTEFVESPGSLEFISIAMVDESDRTLELWNSELRESTLTQWHLENITWPDKGDSRYATLDDIKQQILIFCGNDEVELWAEYGCYDHVLLMWLYGKMIDKPRQLPFTTHDVITLTKIFGFDESHLFQSAKAHDPLEDARTAKLNFYHIFSQVEIEEVNA